MNKVRYIIILFFLSPLIGACDLDVVPENALTYSNSFLTENEVNATTSTIHFFMNSAMQPSSIFNDAGVLYDNSSYGMAVANWSPKGVVGREGDWKSFYDIIYEGNLILDNIYRTENLPKERYNFHVGQARFALGLSYFELAQRYGDCVITKDSKTIEVYGISPMLDVVNFAIEHAEKAYEILPNVEDLKGFNGKVSSKQFASKGSSAALLAHLYAWKGSIIDLYKLEGSSEEAYKKSIEYATLLIDGKVGNYKLCSSVKELSDFLSNPDTDNPEAVFSLTFDKGRSAYSVTPNNVAMSFVAWPINKTVSLGDIIYQTDKLIYKSMVDKLYTDAADERKQTFFYEIDKEHIVDGIDYAIPYKFKKALHEESVWSPSGYDFRSIDADYVYWRLADIILLRAECYAKLNDDGRAIADLNMIRSRAKATLYPSAYDKEDLRKTIFRERDKEFILESGHRYFDIVRNNYIKTELRGKFKELTETDIANGALFLPVPSGAFEDKNGNTTNTLIRQKQYWLPYL